MRKLFESPEYKEFEGYMPSKEVKIRFMRFIVDIEAQVRREAEEEFNHRLKEVKS